MTRPPEQMSGDLQTQSPDGPAAVEKIQQSAEQFRLLVEGVQDYAIYMLSSQGVVTTWNSGSATYQRL
jgi:hypothetical protein